MSMVQSAICLKYSVKRIANSVKNASRRTQDNKKSLNKVGGKELKA
jgi:uncharacterized protein with GYD domain